MRISIAECFWVFRGPFLFVCSEILTIKLLKMSSPYVFHPLKLWSSHPQLISRSSWKSTLYFKHSWFWLHFCTRILFHNTSIWQVCRNHPSLLLLPLTYWWWNLPVFHMQFYLFQTWLPQIFLNPLTLSIFQGHSMTDRWLLWFHLASVLVVGWYLQGTFFQDVSRFLCTTFRLSPKFLTQDF